MGNVTGAGGACCSSIMRKDKDIAPQLHQQRVSESSSHSTPEEDDNDTHFEIELKGQAKPGGTRNGSNLWFNYSDVVPIKYYHYLKEYDFEKNLPSIREHISKFSSH